MSYWEQALIEHENRNGPKLVLAFDNHKLHLKGHLKAIHKPGMIRHLLQHLRLYIRAKRLGLPRPSPLDEIIERLRTKNS